MDQKSAYRKRWTVLETTKVDQAKAILQGVHRWSEGQAYRCLQISAHNNRLTIPEVASRVIASQGDLPFAGPGQEKARLGFCLTWPDRESQKPKNLSA